MPQTFTTDRLVLRLFEMADAPAIVDLLNHADMTRGLAVVPYPYGLTDAESFIDRRPDNAFAVCLKDGSLIGAMGLGAVNEIIEFSAVLMLPDTNVGGYYNTALDLCFNGLGAVVAVLVIGFARR